VVPAPADPASVLDSLLSVLDGTPLEPAAALLQAGGPVVVILLGLSVFALTIILVKLLQFWRLGAGRHRHVNRAIGLWLAGNQVQAYEMLRHRGSAISHAVAHAMRGLNNMRAQDGHVREDVERVAVEQVKKLKSGLRGLEAVVQIAPLLGLFGTVIGMIDAFQALQSAGSQADPAVLAGGIWVALLTTAVGLAVAIPVSFVLYWFESIVEHERLTMESALTSLFTGRITEHEPEAANIDNVTEIGPIANAG
jgi:biopolymer transport protein ExbB